MSNNGQRIQVSFTRGFRTPDRLGRPQFGPAGRPGWCSGHGVGSKRTTISPSRARMPSMRKLIAR